ncbi:hypothetical protein LPB137_11585 [Poseidonibacter parvus]|uniref:histidine kinase n=1 Tax=Poseidonibacter parvus TaxID=1850254 RepID=A0A1P8KPN0_9BACT|nr:cache domain-containing protein [Poseidonibacter parvus]APW66449.1 hypothetical protein LPB137_11585 [Poseidonibacter parvus]
MELQRERLILFLIRFLPLTLIIILSILLTYFMSINHYDNLQDDRKSIQEKYIEENRIIVESNINSINEYIKKELSLSKNELKKTIQTQVYNAHDIMSSIYKTYKNTKTKNEIKDLIKSALKDIRFNQNRGYFFIYELDGTNIFHPIQSQREGKNFFNAQDINGTYIVQESIDIAKSQNKEGFQNWYFNKVKNDIKEYEKIGFIKKFEPYDWFVGTGEYVEDFISITKDKILTHISILNYHNDSAAFVIDYDENVLVSYNTKYSKSKEYKSKKIDDLNEFITSNKDDNFINKKQKDGNIEYTYLKKVDTLNFLIGLSFDLESAKVSIDKRIQNLENKFAENLKTIFISSLIITILLLIISHFISRYFEGLFNNYKETLSRQNKILNKAQAQAKIGSWEQSNNNDSLVWSNEVYHIFEVSLDHDLSFDDFLSIVHPDDREELQSKFQNSVQNKEEYYFEHRLLFNDGRIKYVIERAEHSYDHNNIHIGTLGTVQDITIRKETLLSIQEQEKIIYNQSKMAAMGEMLGNIAHQWRQPLSTITTCATGSKLQKELDSLSDEQLYSSLDTINSSAQYLSHTIEDFRSFFNPTNNKIAEFKILNTIDKTLTLLTAQFKANEIMVIKDIEDIETISIENELIQVLINIFNNSRDALLNTSEQKRYVFINVSTDENNVVIKIKDNAKGIPLDIIDRVFEPYFTTKHKSKGTGIGLYMSEEIVRAHLNGSIEVKNETFEYEGIEYTGAEFTIKLANLSKDI